MPSASAEGKLLLTWADVHHATMGLASRMKKHGYQPARILGISRGGLVPAVMLAHAMGVQEVGSIQLESYNGEERDKVRMYKQLDLEACGLNNFQYWGGHAAYWDKPDTLVVDDLWDSGDTIDWMRAMYPQTTTTTLFFKDRDDNSHKIVSFPGAALNKDRWVVFPWEPIK